MKSYTASFKLVFDNKDFLKGTEAIRKAVSDMQKLFKNLGNTVDSEGNKVNRYVSTALNSFNTLGKGLSSFTSNAIKESAKIRDAFSRIPMFLDGFSMVGSPAKKINGEDYYNKTRAMDHIYNFVRSYGDSNPNKNMSYSELAESFGTFLSGGFNIKDAESGVKGLSYAMRIFPEIDKNTLTSSLVNTYNQMNLWFKKNRPELELDEKGSEKKMEHILNTFTMMSNKFRFDLVKGENPFKVLTKSLTSNAISGNFDLESLTVLAGTMTSAGNSVAEVDTAAINNFIVNLPRAERHLGVSLKGKSLTDTLETILGSGKSGISYLKNAFTMRGMKPVILGMKDIETLKEKIKQFQEANREPKEHKQSAYYMSQSFASSEKAMKVTTANFQSHYGRIARGFTWLKNDFITNFLSMVNMSQNSSSTIVRYMSNIAIASAGAIGGVASAFVNYSSSVSALINVARNTDTIKSSFLKVINVMGMLPVLAFRGLRGMARMVIGIIPMMIKLVAMSTAWAVANWTALAPILAIGVAVGAVIAILWQFKDYIVDALSTAWEWLNSFEIIRTIFEKIGKAVKWLWDTLKGFWNYFISVFKNTPKVENEEIKGLGLGKGLKGNPLDGAGGGRGGRGRAEKDEFLKARGYFVQNVTKYSKGVVYPFFPGEKNNITKNTTSSSQSKSIVDLTKNSEIDTLHDTPTMALAILDTNVIKIRDYVKEILDILKERERSSKNSDFKEDDIVKLLERELGFVYL